MTQAGNASVSLGGVARSPMRWRRGFVQFLALARAWG